MMGNIIYCIDSVIDDGIRGATYREGFPEILNPFHTSFPATANLVYADKDKITVQKIYTKRLIF